METYLFIHGAFQGGWVWKDVAKILHTAGHEVHAPTLRHCGHLSHSKTHSAGLGDYIDDVCAYLEMEDLEGVTLVAHSYSGMICGPVMTRMKDRIKQAVFVDAVIPEADCSFAELAGEQFQQMLNKHTVEQNMVTPWPTKVFGVAGLLEPHFKNRLRPFPLQAFQDPCPERVQPGAIPVRYITCEQTVSGFIRNMAQKAINHGWPVYPLASGHCPMITCPEALTDLLVATAP